MPFFTDDFLGQYKRLWKEYHYEGQKWVFHDNVYRRKTKQNKTKQKNSGLMRINLCSWPRKKSYALCMMGLPWYYSFRGFKSIISCNMCIKILKKQQPSPALVNRRYIVLLFDNSRPSSKNHAEKNDDEHADLTDWKHAVTYLHMGGKSPIQSFLLCPPVTGTDPASVLCLSCPI